MAASGLQLAGTPCVFAPNYEWAAVVAPHLSLVTHSHTPTIAAGLVASKGRQLNTQRACIISTNASPVSGSVAAERAVPAGRQAC